MELLSEAPNLAKVLKFQDNPEDEAMFIVDEIISPVKTTQITSQTTVVRVCSDENVRLPRFVVLSGRTVTHKTLRGSVKIKEDSGGKRTGKNSSKKSLRHQSRMKSQIPLRTRQILLLSQSSS